MKEIIANINGKKVLLDSDFIQNQIDDNPSWHRTRLSKELCKIWNWRGQNGQVKDMACRKLLLRLERNGQITLPVLRRQSPNSLRNKTIPIVSHSTIKIQAQLRTQSPLTITLVKERTDDAALFNYLLSKYHYLGFRNPVGENLKYLVKSRSGTPLSCLLYSSAAWKTQARDVFIGWDTETRELNLAHIANNARFLILPWIEVPNLASHLLAKISQRISSDWTVKYGHPVYLLETFVDCSRFLGICYKAANWIQVGQTKGRTRDDRYYTIQAPVKDIYLFPLIDNFHDKLRYEC
jgi:hypothetical protein